MISQSRALLTNPSRFPRSKTISILVRTLTWISRAPYLNKCEVGKGEGWKIIERMVGICRECYRDEEEYCDDDELGMTGRLSQKTWARGIML